MKLFIEDCITQRLYYMYAYNHTHARTHTRSLTYTHTHNADRQTDTLYITKDLGAQYVVIWHENKICSLGQLSGSKVGADTAEKPITIIPPSNNTTTDHGDMQQPNPPYQPSPLVAQYAVLQQLNIISYIYQISSIFKTLHNQPWRYFFSGQIVPVKCYDSSVNSILNSVEFIVYFLLKEKSS